MSWAYKPQRYDLDSTLTMSAVALLSLRKVRNPEDAPFLWKLKRTGLGEFEQRFDHTKARNGAMFQDGNNGDHWRVIVALPLYKRLLVQNLSQDFVTIMYWED